METANMVFNSKGKQKVRSYILKRVESTENPSFLDFFGSGHMYNLVMKTNAKILSIDKDKKIKKRMKNLPNTFYGDIQTICKEQKSKFNIIFLDYCGLFCTTVRKDIEEIPKIMKEEGSLFITILHGREHYVEKGTTREDIERFNDYTIRELLLKKGIYSVQKKIIGYPSIPIYKGKTKRRKTNATTMKVYEYIWKKTKNNRRMIEQYKSLPMTSALNL